MRWSRVRVPPAPQHNARSEAVCACPVVAVKTLAEAGVTPAILYRHFASKADLYREVLDSAYARLREATGADHFDDASIPAVVHASAANPDAFRLLFRQPAANPSSATSLTHCGPAGLRSPTATSRPSPTTVGGAGQLGYYPPSPQKPSSPGWTPASLTVTTPPPASATSSTPSCRRPTPND
ncbi:MAG: TetR family transcriptional regulator [Gemmataceae bacterium]